MCFILKQQPLNLKNIRQAVELIQYDPDKYSRQLFSAHNIQQPEQLSEWVTKRQAQFLAGRIAARNALQAINSKQENTVINIGIGTHREPLWPKNIMGSISHDGDIAIATAAQQNRGGIGLDIQTVFNQQETQQYRKLILSQSDQTFFQKGNSGMSESQLMTLIFSAKESFFKAVFDHVKEYFDFNDVCITSFNGQTGQLTLACNHDALGGIIKPGINDVVYFDWLSHEQKDRIVTFINTAR
jgi:4'-phosphopantetheinyl transferase EntD